MGIEHEIVEQLSYKQALRDTGEYPLKIRVVSEYEPALKYEEFNEAEQSLHKARETISEMWKYQQVLESKLDQEIQQKQQIESMLFREKVEIKNYHDKSEERLLKLNQHLQQSLEKAVNVLQEHNALQNKIKSIEEALEESKNAYDEVS